MDNAFKDNTDRSVVNLSTFQLSDKHISLLQRGLKFCPTPPAPNAGQLREDMDRFHTRMRQIAFFDNIENDSSSTTSFINTTPTAAINPMASTVPFKNLNFKLKSSWRVPNGPINLEAMIACNEQQFNARPTFKTNYKNNIDLMERQALKELLENKNIIIKPADKGSAVVIMNRLDYLREGYRQLSDTKYYIRLDNEPTADFRKEVAGFVEDMYQNGEIDESVQKYLMYDTYRTPQLYLLPKIHKGLNPPPGRPIISANGCPTENISQFVDFFLNPTCLTLPSFVKDTTHFLRLINDLGTLPDNCILVTMDVSSLYTNIPNIEGLTAARIALDTARPQANIKPTNASLIKLLELVLTKNNFQFNGVNFLQVGGTAMGTKVAPSFAVTYMGSFEREHVYTYRLKPIIYLRYIDDIFIIWPHGPDELEQFTAHMNSCSTHIKFTTEKSSSEIPFLDTLVRLDNGHLTTDLYTKPTDSHNYLYYNSSHPQRCKDSIPYSQFLRIRRICSDNKDFDKHVLILSGHFLRRKYPLKIIKDAALLARGLSREHLLSQTPKDQTSADKDKVFLVTTYHPGDRCVPDIARHNWSILGRNQATETLFHKQLTCGYRRPKNLRDLLCKAKVGKQTGDELADPTYVPTATMAQEATPIEPPRIARKQTSIKDFLQKPPIETSNSTNTASLPNLPTRIPGPVGKTGRKHMRGFPFCGATRTCKYCPYLNKTGKIKSTTTGKTHPAMRNVSCRSSNLVYAITCQVCGMQYVGQTLLRLQDRFVGHFGDIKRNDHNKPVAAHFTQAGHNRKDDVQITILEFIKKPPRSPQAITIRHKVEFKWTHTLRTLAPQGINLENPKEYSSHQSKK